MVSAGMPELSCEEDINYLKNMLCVTATTKQAEARFKAELKNSVTSTITKINNYIHNSESLACPALCLETTRSTHHACHDGFLSLSLFCVCVSLFILRTITTLFCVWRFSCSLLVALANALVVCLRLRMPTNPCPRLFICQSSTAKGDSQPRAPLSKLARRLVLFRLG